MIAVTQRVILVDSVMAALHFQRNHKVTIKPATIRQWAARKKITTHHGSERRYDLRELEKYAREKGLLAK